MPTIADLAAGTEIMITESGALVPFLILQHGYPAAGNGRTLLIRKKGKTAIAFGTTRIYNGSTLDSYMESTYFNMLDAAVQGLISSVGIPSYQSALTTLQRKVFALSGYEIGFTVGNGQCWSEGSPIPYFNSDARRITLNDNDSQVGFWTRGWYRTGTDLVAVTMGNSGMMWYSSCTVGGTYYARPAFTLPSAQSVNQNEGGTYSLVFASQASVQANIGSLDKRPKEIKPFSNIYVGTLTGLFVCNNMNDAAPSWEAAQDGQVHRFVNQVKTAAQWAIGLMITATSEGDTRIGEPYALVRW